MKFIRSQNHSTQKKQKVRQIIIKNFFFRFCKMNSKEDRINPMLEPIIKIEEFKEEEGEENFFVVSGIVESSNDDKGSAEEVECKKEEIPNSSLSKV